MDYLQYINPVGRVEGLMSGIDTGAIVEALGNVQRAPITQLESRKQDQQQLLATYQSVTAALLNIKNCAAQLQAPDTYSQRAVDNTHPALLTASAAAGTAVGNYEIVISQLAAAHKISSAAIADTDSALGYDGDIVINGQTIRVQDTFTLNDIASAINEANAGVTASLLNVSDSEHYLVLTADRSGAANAIDLVEANSGNILQNLGLVAAAPATKHALTQGMASDYFADDSTPVGTLLGLSGSLSGTIQVNGTDVDIDLGTDSLNTIADRITAQVTGVTATVTSDTVEGETRYRLEIVGDSAAPTLTDDGNVLEALGLQTKPVANELQAAQDAMFSLDGFNMTRPTNSVDDVVEGLSLELQQADPSTTVTVTVSADYGDVVTELQGLVGKFNELMDVLNSGLSYDADTGQGGELIGESTIMLLQMDLVQQVINPVATLGALDESTSLSELGLSLDENGKLQLDTAALQSALSENPERVQRLLGTTAWADNSEVEYVASTSATRESGPAGYEVNITQAATRATATSASLPDGITHSETLTFYGTYQFILQPGMSLAQAAEALNAFFENSSLSLSAAVIGDQLVIRHNLYGSNYDIEITSSLDDGVGGSDLGGALAGEAAVYTGRDVAGTINGEPATGNGQWLTGDEGNENTAGLMLRITSTTTGDKGAVYISKGMGTRLMHYIEGATGDVNGSLTIAQQADKHEQAEPVDYRVEHGIVFPDIRQAGIRGDGSILRRSQAPRHHAV